MTRPYGRRQSYASIITAASSLIMQISDRFHLMQNLKKDAVEPIKALLGQTRMKQPYTYPSEDEAYRYIMEDILEMGDARHRKKVRTYYDVRRLKDEGKSIAETAKHLGIRSRKAHQIEEAQKCMVKEIRDYADYIKKDAEPPKFFFTIKTTTRMLRNRTG
jgi:hypothetical protein